MQRSHPNNWNFDEPMEPKTEVLNPSVACGFSRDIEENHAPTGLTDPFVSARIKK